MKLMNKEPHCAECQFMKMYDITYKNYYCDHEDRINEMGKLGVDHPPKTSPVWCPLRGNADSDLIKIESDIHLKDKEGKPIEIKSIQPECLDRV